MLPAQICGSHYESAGRGQDPGQICDNTPKKEQEGTHSKNQNNVQEKYKIGQHDAPEDAVLWLESILCSIHHSTPWQDIRDTLGFSSSKMCALDGQGARGIH